MTKEWVLANAKREDLAHPSSRISARFWGGERVGLKIPTQTTAIGGPRPDLILMDFDLPDPSLFGIFEFEGPSSVAPHVLRHKSPIAVQTGEEHRWVNALTSLQLTLYSVNQQVAALRDEIRELRGTRVFGLEITTLAPESFEILRPIPVTIEGSGDNFIATYFEGNVSASGDTESEALANFKDSLISRYEILENTPEDKLGPLPKRQWEILRTLVRRTD